MARALGEMAVVGESFALLAPGMVSSEAVLAIAGPLGLVSGGSAGRVVPLWGEGEVALPGAVAQARVLPRWRPCGLWSDRLVYDQGAAVNLVLTCPGHRVAEVEVHLAQRGEVARSLRVALHGGGIGHMVVEGLSPGVWRAHFEIPGDGARTQARFAVLSSGAGRTLMARWLCRRLEADPGASRRGGQVGTALRFGVILSAFDGVPVSGPVEVGLLDLRQGGRSKVGVVEPDPFGVVWGKATLPSEGPLALCLGSEILGGETRLVIPGADSRGAPLDFGPLSGGVIATARADEGDSALGLRLFEAEGEGPLKLGARPVEGALVVESRRNIHALSAVTLEPLSRRVRTHVVGDLEAGAVREMSTEDPLGIVVAAGFVEEDGELKPWESWGGWLSAPGPSAVSLAWSGEGVEVKGDEVLLEAGSRPRVIIKGGQAPVPVLILVRWERTASRQAGHEPVGVTEPLGARLWRDVADLGAVLEGRGGLRTLFEAAGGQRGLERAIARLKEMSRAEPRGVVATSTLREKAVEALDALPVEGAQLETLMIKVVQVAEEARVSLPVMPPHGVVHVEAIAASSPHWSMGRLCGRAGAFARVRLWVPPFVDQGDEALARLSVWTWSGVSRLFVDVDGVPVVVTRHPRREGDTISEVGAGGALPGEASLSFPVRPGVWRVRVEGPVGEPPIERCVVVSKAGSRRHLVHRIAAVSPGDGRILAEEVGAVGGLSVSPPLPRRLGVLIDAVLSAPWVTCESHAARAVAAVVGLSEESAGEGRARLEAVLDQSAAALEALFVPGRGFARGRAGGVMDAHMSALSVRHLLRLEALAGQVSGLGEGVQTSVKRIGKLARRAAIAANVVLPPPPDGLRDADDADLLLCLRPDRVAVAAATARSRLKRRASRMDAEANPTRRGAFARGEVSRRCDSAYGARVLLQTGDIVDRRVALSALASALSGSRRAFMAPEVGAYNTVDATALIFALHTLSQTSLPSAEVEVQGPPEAASSIDVLEGLAWVGWHTWVEHDLTDPAAQILFEVSLRPTGSKSPEVRYALGQKLDLHINLGAPAQGFGWRYGDRVEIHLPAALAPASPLSDWPLPAGGAGIEGRRLFIDPAGRHQFNVPLQAVSPTGLDGANPSAQHMAAGLLNLYDSGRGRALVGLDVTVTTGGKGLGSRLFKAFGFGR